MRPYLEMGTGIVTYLTDTSSRTWWLESKAFTIGGELERA